MFSNSQLFHHRKLVFAALLLALPASADVGLGLSPMRNELTLAPGATYTGTLRLAAEADGIRARTTLLDFFLDTEQTPQFEEGAPAEAAHSCRNWLTVNPMETQVPEKSQVVVRYTLRVPADARPRGYHCAIGFTSMTGDPNAPAIGLRTAIRIVSAFYITVGQPAVEGKLSAISLERAPGGKELRAVVVMDNTGLIYYRPKGTVQVTTLEGLPIESFEINSVPVLPERKQRLLFPLTKLAEGQPCRIVVRVDFGTGEIQEGVTTIQAGVPGRDPAR